jgi:membrane-bound ClpP family serine protease
VRSEWSGGPLTTNVMELNNLTLAYILIAAGFLLLVAELFLPSSGVLFVLSIGAVAVGVVITFFNDLTVGWVTLVSVFFAFPLFVGFALHWWPRTRMGRRFFLAAPNDDEAIASMPVNVELEHLRGRFGRTVSALRPSGVADFDGNRVDVITEGLMVDPGQWVRCIDIRAGRVIVRPAEKPNLGDFESAIFSPQ